MYSVDKAAGQVLADDTMQSIDAVDRAVMSFAHLSASIVEVSKASNLPVTTVQGALANATNGLSKLVSSRDDLGQAARELLVVQKNSNLQTTAFGCPVGCGPKPTGELSDTPSAVKQSA